MYRYSTILESNKCRNAAGHEVAFQVLWKIPGRTKPERNGEGGILGKLQIGVIRDAHDVVHPIQSDRSSEFAPANEARPILQSRRMTGALRGGVCRGRARALVKCPPPDQVGTKRLPRENATGER